jgi:hypothetical protein
MASELDDAKSALAGARLKLKNTLTGDYSSAEEFKPGIPGGLNRAEYIRELRETIKFLTEEVNRLDVYEINSEMYPS